MISTLIHVVFQITLATDLIAVDATEGTMTLDWSFMYDTACDATQNPPCPSLNPNSTVDIFFDMYVYFLSAVVCHDDLPSPENLDLETFCVKMTPEQYRLITYQINPSFATMPPLYIPLRFATP